MEITQHMLRVIPSGDRCIGATKGAKNKLKTCPYYEPVDAKNAKCTLLNISDNTEEYPTALASHYKVCGINLEPKET
jgi:hypothetical protein